MPSAPPIGFEYRPSRGLTLAVALMAALAVLAVLLSGLGRWAQLGLIVLAVILSARALWALRRPRIAACRWGEDDNLHLHLRGKPGHSAVETAGKLAAHHALGPLIILQARWPSRGRETLWLLPDNLDADTHRRLRVRLHATTAGEGGRERSG